MKDFIGQELNIGDIIICNPPTYKGLVLAKIISFTPKGVRVEQTANKYYGNRNFVRMAGEVVRKPLTEEEIRARMITC